MANGFRKPESKVYKSFLYLDSDEVINSLSALEGGDVDEVLTRTGEEGSGGIGAEVGAGPVKGKGGKQKTRKFEEEMRRKRTIHSAAATLLRKLHSERAIGVIEGAYGAEIYEQLEDHLLLEFRAHIRIHPLHQAVSAAEAFQKVAPHYGISKEELREVSEVLPLMRALSEGADGAKKSFLVFAEAGPDSDTYRLALPIRAKHLLVDLDDFSGRATFVAQVDRILAPGDQVLAIRLIRNAPQLGVERDAMAEGKVEFASALEGLGLDVSEKDFVLERPAVILKPVCVYK